MAYITPLHGARFVGRVLRAALAAIEADPNHRIRLNRDQAKVCAEAVSLFGETPAGYRAVPVQATDAMVEAFDRALLTYKGQRFTRADMMRLRRYALTQAIAASPAARYGDNEPERVRHLKRGTTYDVLCRTGEVQAAAPIFEGDVLVTYVGADGRVWHRPAHEFADPARFEVIDEPPPASLPASPAA